MATPIPTADGYRCALLEQRRIMEVFHDDKLIARAFYAEQGPSKPSDIFDRIVRRHRARQLQDAHTLHQQAAGREI